MYIAEVKRKIPKGTTVDKSQKREARRKIKAGVYGLRGILRRHPFSVPKHAPAALTALSKVAGRKKNREAIGAVVAAGYLAEFKKTHSDEWEEHKRKFTAEELDALSEHFLPANYYA